MEALNPHTRYEIPIDRSSRWLALAAAILAMTVMVLSIWLASTTPGEILPGARPKLPRVNVPTQAQIQQHVDAHNPVVQAAEGKVQ